MAETAAGPRKRKPKSQSTYQVQEIQPRPMPNEQDQPAPATLKVLVEKPSMKAAQAFVDKSEVNFEYQIVCVRERGVFKTETVGRRVVSK